MVITQEQFDSLLSWLGSDRELAAKKYETIRAGLVRIFISKGFSDAEDLADETINRVMIRLPDIRASYKGEQACYFHGVARYVIRERLRRKETARDVVDFPAEYRPELSEEQKCFGRCLDHLPDAKRNFILDYYSYDGHEKVEHHKQMAGQLRITEGAMRSRAFQIRLNIENCIRQCPLRKGAEECRLHSFLK